MSAVSGGHKALGVIGEELACQFLRRSGYKILTRNYKSALGEIDVIARQDKTLVFIEVKSRRSETAGEPLESVTYFKRGQIIRCAKYYLSRFNLHDCLCRFDAVSVKINPEGTVDIYIVPDAFGVGAL